MGYYDRRGSAKDTYRACSATFTYTAATTPFFVLEGSATRIVEVQRVTVTVPTLTAAAYLAMQAKKCSAAATGNAGVVLTKVPCSSGATISQNASTVNRCTSQATGATTGAVIGVIASRRFLASPTAAAAGMQEIVFDFRDGPIVLEGVVQGFTLSFEGAPASDVSMVVEVEWTEV